MYPLRSCIEWTEISYYQNMELKRLRLHLPPTRPRSINGQLRRSFSVLKAKKVTNGTKSLKPVESAADVCAQEVPLSSERPTISAGDRDENTTKCTTSAKENSVITRKTPKVVKVIAEPVRPPKSPIPRN